MRTKGAGREMSKLGCLAVVMSVVSIILLVALALGCRLFWEIAHYSE